MLQHQSIFEMWPIVLHDLQRKVWRKKKAQPHLPPTPPQVPTPHATPPLPTVLSMSWSIESFSYPRAAQFRKAMFQSSMTQD